jgi:hypothetical protein
LTSGVRLPVSYSFEKTYWFLGDEAWCLAHGYSQLPSGQLTRLVSCSLGLVVPPLRWEAYSERLRRGWVPTTQEFAEWHPLDQVRFEGYYVYQLGEADFQKFCYLYITFWAKPLMAITYYDTLWAPLDLSQGVRTLEIYFDNDLALAGRFFYENFVVEHRCTPLRFWRDYLARRLVRCVINASTVMVTYAGCPVFQRTGHEGIDPVKILEGI